MLTAKAYGVEKQGSNFKPMNIERREVLDNDVMIDILYCGICHSDVHQVRNDWGGSSYPIVPGHEIVGKITNVGRNAGEFKIGDYVGVGCMVDSCGKCQACSEGFEQQCEKETVWTYNSVDPHTKSMTLGGYSDKITVDKRFVIRIDSDDNLAGMAPILCAGVTTYSPLKKFGAGPGKHVAVAGLGGLGHMAVKLAKAMGSDVTVFTTSPEKANDAKKLGADKVLVYKNKDDIRKSGLSFNIIIDTIPADHDINALISTLKPNGAVVLVGLPERSTRYSLSPSILMDSNRSLAGSNIGGIPETQEVVDFCVKHNIRSEIELIKFPYLDEAYKRIMKNDVRYRFVIDNSSL